MSILFRVSALMLFFFFALLGSSCMGESGSEGKEGTNPKSTEDGNEVSPIGSSNEIVAFTHKMMKGTGENQFATLAYECSKCTFEQWLAIEPPEGWTKGPAQVALFSSGELRSTPFFEGVPVDMDFIEEVPGNEYQLIAKNLDGRLVEAGANGIVVEVQVMRDTLLRFDAGKRVHELTDPDGNVFVLFTYQVDPENVVIPDVEDPEFLGEFNPPTGWAYTSRILESELLLDTSEIATVLAIRGPVNSTWERR